MQNLPMPLPLVDLDRIMAEERAGYKAHLESVTSLLRDTERERQLLQQQLDVLKKLVATQDARASKTKSSNLSASRSSSMPISNTSDSQSSLGEAPICHEYIKTVVLRYLETHDTSLLPVLRQVVVFALCSTTYFECN